MEPDDRRSGGHRALVATGARHAYHTNTYGHLIGEIGATAQRRELPRPAPGPGRTAGKDDVCFGVPAEEQRRCVDIQWAGSDNPSVEWSALSGDEYMTMRSYFNPPGYSSVGVVNTPAWRSAEVPSTNGHGTACGVASILAALLEPNRLLPAISWPKRRRPSRSATARCWARRSPSGSASRPPPQAAVGPNPDSFGHFGTGGAVGFADPHSGVAFGYVMNQVIPRWQSTRNRALIAAVFASL